MGEIDWSAVAPDEPQQNNTPLINKLAQLQSVQQLPVIDKLARLGYTPNESGLSLLDLIQAEQQPEQQINAGSARGTETNPNVSAQTNQLDSGFSRQFEDLARALGKAEGDPDKIQAALEKTAKFIQTAGILLSPDAILRFNREMARLGFPNVQIAEITHPETGQTSYVVRYKRGNDTTLQAAIQSPLSSFEEGTPLFNSPGQMAHPEIAQ